MLFKNKAKFALSLLATLVFASLAFANPHPENLPVETSYISVLYCGDEVTQEDHLGEECDDGNTSNEDLCTNACEVARCGDGFIQPPAGENCEPSINPAHCVNCVYSPPPPAPDPLGPFNGGRRGVHYYGCFDLDTEITLADGSTKKAKNIKAGDMVYNPITDSATRVSEKIISGPEELALVEFGFGDTTVKVTTKHPVVTISGIKKAIDLTLNDQIMDAEGNYHVITTLKRPKYEAGLEVINFELEGGSSAVDHYLISDGIITGDLYLQGLFENE